MSYPNYLDSPQNGIPASPRQAPPSPSPSMNHANGMNGMGLNTGMVGFPTPAGHQADLNFVMSMVEELSRTLEHNRRLTQNIVEGVGRVRERAKDTHLTNDELIASVAAELNGKHASDVDSQYCLGTNTDRFFRGLPKLGEREC